MAGAMKAAEVEKSDKSEEENIRKMSQSKENLGLNQETRPLYQKMFEKGGKGGQDGDADRDQQLKQFVKALVQDPQNTMKRDAIFDQMFDSIGEKSPQKMLFLIDKMQLEMQTDPNIDPQSMQIVSDLNQEVAKKIMLQGDSLDPSLMKLIDHLEKNGKTLNDPQKSLLLQLNEIKKGNVNMANAKMNFLEIMKTLSPEEQSHICSTITRAYSNIFSLGLTGASLEQKAEIAVSLSQIQELQQLGSLIGMMKDRVIFGCNRTIYRTDVALAESN
jgi:hypothetical protein